MLADLWNNMVVPGAVEMEELKTAKPAQDTIPVTLVLPVLKMGLPACLCGCIDSKGGAILFSHF